MAYQKGGLTEEQKEVLMQVMRFAGIFADQIRHIFHNHGFDNVRGASLRIEVNPMLKYTTNTVSFGMMNMDAGELTISKGDEFNAGYDPIGKNTAELERLFTDGLPEKGTAKRAAQEKELPPDGLWISRFDDPPYVDGGV